MALYVALIAASVLLAGMVLLFRLYKNKGRDHSMYNMANSGTYFIIDHIERVSLKYSDTVLQLLLYSICIIIRRHNNTRTLSI